MAEIPFWYVGDLNPSITDTATDESGTALNLTGLSARFKMRPLNSDTLTVDQPVSNTLDSTGVLRYDWQAADVDTAGMYLAWWEITTSGRVQAVGEALIEIREHGPATGLYLELEELRQRANIQATTLHDRRALNAIEAACRVIDAYCGDTSFHPTTGVTRYYTAPAGALHLPIGDWAAVTEVKVDDNRDGFHEITWTASTDYTLAPVNAGTVEPYRTLVIPEWSARRFPRWTNAVKVTGTYGWPTTPPVVREAAEILATRLFKRADTPYGILTVGTEMVAAARLGRIDPDVATLLENLPGRDRPGQLRSVRLG